MSVSIPTSVPIQFLFPIILLTYYILWNFMFIATVTSLVPQLFTAMFDPEQYQSLVDTNIPIGADLFTAFFIINSSATITYISFDIIDDMMVGESVSNSDLLLNGTRPPLVLSRPFQSMFWLTISTGRIFDAVEIRENITFTLFSFVRAVNGDFITSSANLILYGIGNKIKCIFVTV